MDTYILDTNLFFNMEARMGLGGTTAEIMANLSRALKKAKTDEIHVCMPPSIHDELRTFFDHPDDQTLSEFIGFVTVKSPSIAEISLSAQVVHGIIGDYRERGYRGMKVCEEELIKTAELFMGREVLPQKEFQMTIGKMITKLRDRYRNATRTGTIDSAADFDLIMLAKEQNGFLVSTDEGVIRWAREIGVNEMDSSVFGKKMQAYL